MSKSKRQFDHAEAAVEQGIEQPPFPTVDHEATTEAEVVEPVPAPAPAPTPKAVPRDPATQYAGGPWSVRDGEVVHEFAMGMEAVRHVKNLLVKGRPSVTIAFGTAAELGWK
jgi:hypothetical protein